MISRALRRIAKLLTHDAHLAGVVRHLGDSAASLEAVVEELERCGAWEDPTTFYLQGVAVPAPLQRALALYRAHRWEPRIGRAASLPGIEEPLTIRSFFVLSDGTRCAELSSSGEGEGVLFRVPVASLREATS